jgi:hypothetical protein
MTSNDFETSSFNYLKQIHVTKEQRHKVKNNKSKYLR